MKRFIISIVSLLMPGVVQGYGTCSQIRAIPPATFIQVYYTSEADANAAASAWAECQRRHNTDALSHLTDTPLQEVRELATEAADAWLGLQQTRWQGGTLYLHLRIRQQTEIERWIGDLIDIYQAEQASLESAVLTEAIHWNWQRLEADVMMLEEYLTSDKLNALIAEVNTDPVAFRSDWEAHVSRYRSVVNRLKALFEGRDDVITYEVLEYFVREAALQTVILELAAG